MRTVLCTPAARRAALLLALVAGTAGRRGADCLDGGRDRVAEGARRATTGTPRPSGAVLGPAVKYVRESDGTVRQVR